MALSNTAVPKYYGRFREKVLAGEIFVNEEISLEMNRIDGLIENKNFYYDEKAIDGWIAFCESELTLTDGSDLVLLDSFKLWAEALLSWFYYQEISVYTPNENGRGGRHVRTRIKKRLVTKQYLIVARGGAKSMYAMCIQAYFLVVYSGTTHQITTAPVMLQAEEVLSPLRTAILKSRGPLFKFLTSGSLQNTTGQQGLRQKLASTKKGIENMMSGSLLEVRPMSVNKLQGARPYVTTVDEWLSGDTREDVVGAIEQGASKDQGPTSSDEYIIVAISSEGTVRNGVGDSIKMELSKILRDEYWNPFTSIFHYKLDSIDEVGNPEMYVKAQPNIGITVHHETYQRDVERAEAAPSTRNDILAKRFGIPMEGQTYFFTFEETQLHRKRSFWRMPCSMGADLSQGDDFCAFTFLFPLGDGTFGVKTRSYITGHTLYKLSPSIREKYEEFMAEGTLHVFESSTVLDMLEVYQDVIDHAETNEYDIRSFGYDPYNSEKFVEEYTKEHGSLGLERVIQGVRTESVPLGELKKLAAQRALLFDEKLMSFAIGNAVVSEDTNGNRKLYKRRHEEKIDNVASTMDALVAYKRNLDRFD